MLTAKQLDEFEKFVFESRLRGDEARLGFETKTGREYQWSNALDRTKKYGDPRARKFTQFAAKMIGGHNALNAGRCPTCSEEIKEFRNDISRKEFSISGMCQDCQDSVFGKD